MGHCALFAGPLGSLNSCCPRAPLRALCARLPYLLFFCLSFSCPLASSSSSSAFARWAAARVVSSYTPPRGGPLPSLPRE